MTTTPAITVDTYTRPRPTAANQPLAERVARGMARRAGRLRMAMLVFILFLPLLATAVLGGR
jgi:hypothetical protein